MMGKKIESRIRKALYEYKLLDGVEKLGVALSGGKDSLTLLYQLKAILGRGFPLCELVALHVGGPFSCGASVHPAHLQKICDELEVTLLVRDSSMTPDKLACYPCSRQRRRLLFE